MLVVEDDVNVRNRIAEIVDGHGSLRLAGAVGSHQDACAYLEDQPQPDLVLVDLGLPDGDGVDLIRRSRESDRPPEVMVLTAFGDERHVVAAIEAGASGYLLKDDDPGNIGAAIVDVLEGNSPISAGIARHLLRRLQAPVSDAPAPSAPGPALTRREFETLELVARGFTYAEIARLLSISVNTVTSHIKNLYAKLQVSSRSEAVFEAVQLGLIQLER